MVEYTAEQKQAMYRAGQYVFNAPPVCTVLWSEAIWIKWIDGANGWRPPDLPRLSIKALGYEWTPDPSDAKMYIRGRKLDGSEDEEGDHGKIYRLRT